MKRALILFGLIGIAVMPFTVRGQTCDSPLLISSNMASVGTTCGAPDSLPHIGTIPSPHSDVVYTFYGGPHLGGYLDAWGFPQGVVYLLPSPCSPNTDPIRVGGLGGFPIIDLDDLPPDDYFLVVTGHGNAPPEACGEYTLELHTYLVDLIFRDGFELEP